MYISDGNKVLETLFPYTIQAPSFQIESRYFQYTKCFLPKEHADMVIALRPSLETALNKPVMAPTGFKMHKTQSVI